MFWLWAMDNVENGDLSDFMNDEIAEVAGWDKDSDQFVEALISSGFIDADMHIHDWEEYIGKLLERRKSEVDRVTKAREKKRGKSGNEINKKDEIIQENDCNERSTFAESSQDVTANITRNERSTFAGKSRVDKSRVDTSINTSNIDITDVISLSPDGDEPPGKIKYQDIADMYNAICGHVLAKCTKMSEARKKAINARFKSGYTIADIELVFKKAAESTFLHGGNSKNWQADFDWLLSDANIAKVLDGKYDNRDSAPLNGSDQSGSNIFAEMLEEGYGNGT